MTVPDLTAPHIRFDLPAELSATEPPEHRGLPRDGVRLLVARPDGVRHRRFRDLADELEPGDLIVVNTSATLPAALDAERIRTGERRAGPTVVHVSTQLDDGHWVVEVRRPDGTGPEPDVAPGEWLRLPGGVELTVLASYPEDGVPGSRLWRATAEPATRAATHLARYGRPVGYGYLRGTYPLAAYQTIFAHRPGSAEMPSASRPFSPELLVRLTVRGVTLAPLTLHCGLSSAETGEPPAPEPFTVPPDTARLVNAARTAGRRVVAAGTTVVRALESATTPDGTVQPARGWADLVLHASRPARTVTGLITGWHAPRATHLALLEAVAGPDLVRAAYTEALDARYLWHEFGDSALLLP
jgi:S-adenosylmethionine:tRNA ribosyltransferase-isomerase